MKRKTKIFSFFSSQSQCLFNDESFPFEELRNTLKTNFYNQDYCLHYCQAKEIMKRCQCLPHIFKKIFYPSTYNFTHFFFFNFILVNVLLINESKYSLVFDNKSNHSRLCYFDNLPCYEKNILKFRQLECTQCLNNCNYTDYISSQKLEKCVILLVLHTINNLKKFFFFFYPSDAQFINSTVKENSQEISIDLEYWPLLQFRTVIIFSTIEYLRNFDFKNIEFRM